MIDFIHLVGLVGITLIVTHGTLLRGIRRLAPKFLGCPQCIGFHIGFWVTGVQAVLSGVTYGAALHAVLVGGAVSVLSALADGALQHFFGEAIDVELERQISP